MSPRLSTVTSTSQQNLGRTLGQWTRIENDTDVCDHRNLFPAENFALAYNLLVSLCAFVANLFVIAVICRAKQLQHTYFYLICNLAIADMMTVLSTGNALFLRNVQIL